MSMILGTIGTEVLAVNFQTHSVHLVVNLDCRPDELKLPETLAKAQDKARQTCSYLVEEGFLPRQGHQGWLTHIGIVAKRK